MKSPFGKHALQETFTSCFNKNGFESRKTITDGEHALNLKIDKKNNSAFEEDNRTIRGIFQAFFD